MFFRGQPRFDSLQTVVHLLHKMLEFIKALIDHVKAKLGLEDDNE